MAERKEVRRYVRPDGKQIVAMVEIGDGLFSFAEESELWEEPHPAIGDGFAYWCPTVHVSAFYDSIETAERELRELFPWIASSGSPEPQARN
jgi:hypothetical protein